MVLIIVVNTFVNNKSRQGTLHCQSPIHDLSQMNRFIMLKQQLRSGYSTINLICPIASCANSMLTWAYSRLII